MDWLEDDGSFPLGSPTSWQVKCSFFETHLKKGTQLQPPIFFQGMEVGCTPTNVPLWEIPIYPYNTWVFMGYYPQESLYKPYKYTQLSLDSCSICASSVSTLTTSAEVKDVTALYNTLGEELISGCVKLCENPCRSQNGLNIFCSEIEYLR